MQIMKYKLSTMDSIALIKCKALPMGECGQIANCTRHVSRSLGSGTLSLGCDDPARPGIRIGNLQMKVFYGSC